MNGATFLWHIFLCSLSTSSDLDRSALGECESLSWNVIDLWEFLHNFTIIFCVAINFCYCLLKGCIHKWCAADIKCVFSLQTEIELQSIILNYFLKKSHLQFTVTKDANIPHLKIKLFFFLFLNLSHSNALARKRKFPFKL